MRLTNASPGGHLRLEIRFQSISTSSVAEQYTGVKSRPFDPLSPCLSEAFDLTTSSEPVHIAFEVPSLRRSNMISSTMLSLRLLLCSVPAPSCSVEPLLMSSAFAGLLHSPGAAPSSDGPLVILVRNPSEVLCGHCLFPLRHPRLSSSTGVFQRRFDSPHVSSFFVL